MKSNIIHKEDLRGDKNLPDHITVTTFNKETLEMLMNIKLKKK